MDEDVHSLASWDQHVDLDWLTDQARSGALAVDGLLPSEAGSATPWIGHFERPVRRCYLDQPITYLHEPVFSLTPLGRLVSESHRKRLRIEQVTANWPLSYRSNRDKRVDDLQFPNVVRLYFAHCVQAEFPAQPEEFLRVLTSDILRRHGDLPRDSVHARAVMFLAGLVRQHHFALLLREHCCSVIWNERLDREYGVDLLLVHEGREYGLALSVSGERSQAWQERKRYRHPPPDILPICRIEAPLQDFRQGELWLHGDNDLRKVYSFVRSESRARRFRMSAVRSGAR